MNILFDSKALVELAAEAGEGNTSGGSLDELISRPDVSLWITALSFANIERILVRMGKLEKVHALLDLVLKEFSIIPLRRSILAKASEKSGSALERTVQAASAEAFHMDYIVAANGAEHKSSSVPVVSLAELFEKLNSGEPATIGSVPFLDLKAQHHQIYNEIDDRLTDIIANTGFVMGKHVDEFEKNFAKIQEVKYCIGVSSGTDALHVALLTLGIGPGDKVIVPVNTFIATAEAVSLCGATPVFVDCDQYYNMDPEKIREILQNAKDEISHRPTQSDTDILSGRPQYDLPDLRGRPARTKTVIASPENGERISAIIPVHLYGQPANMDEIMSLAEEYNLSVVEDCCQAHIAEWKGKKVGNFGNLGAFSFYPGKNLGAYGEAGALVTNDEELYLRARMLRQHGEIERYHHQVVGHNYRMEAIQGAVLATKLKYIEEWTRMRQRNARLYNKLLADVEEVQTPAELEGVSCVYHLYVIQVDDRDGLREYLQENGVASGLHYPVPLHLQPAYKSLKYQRGNFPVAEKAAERILSLPMYPELSEGQIRYVCEQIKRFMVSPQRRGARRDE